MKRAAAQIVKLGLLQTAAPPTRRELEENNFARRTRREKRRAHHLHAGTCSARNIFARAKTTRISELAEKIPGPSTDAFQQTREETQSRHHRLAVRETRRRRLSQHRRRH
jgi:hypothetical protein